jgi:hypothetical protein
MEVGIFAADPRAIASPKAKVVCVSLKLRVEIEALVPLVIRAAKVLIPEKVVRRPAMYPQAIVFRRPRVSREHRRGHNGAKNSYRAQRFDHGHWFSSFGRSPVDQQPCSSALKHFLFSVRRSRYRRAYDTHAPLLWESGPLPLIFAHMPLPKSSRARLSPSICFIAKLHIELTGLVGLVYSTQRAFLSPLRGAARCRVRLSAGCLWAPPMRPARQIWRPIAARLFFEDEEE